MFDDGGIACTPRNGHDATLIVRHIDGRQVGDVGLGRWVGNGYCQRSREVAGDTKSMNALHPIGPRLTGLDGDIDGVVRQGRCVGGLQVNGLASGRTIDGEVQQVISEVSDGLPINDHAVGLHVRELEHRRRWKRNVGCAVHVGDGRIFDFKTPVSRGVELERYGQRSRSGRHLLVERVTQVSCKAGVGVDKEVRCVANIKAAEGEVALRQGVHGEVHPTHLDAVIVRGVGKARAEHIERLGEVSGVVLNHQHGQAVASVSCVAFRFNIGEAVLVHVIADLVIGRDEHTVLRALADENEVFVGAVAVHVAKVNGAWSRPGEKHIGSCAAHSIR